MSSLQLGVHRNRNQMSQSSKQSKKVTICTPEPEKPDLRNVSLREIIASRTHTAVGDVQFDCPPVPFTPPGEFVESYGGVTVLANPVDSNGLLNIVNYTSNQMMRLRSCVKSHHA